MKERKRPRILVVDDDPINVSILEEILSEEYELLTASRGDEALSKAEEFVPDLVLLDIMMPGMDGYETCRRLRTMERLKNVKVILVSAKAMLSERLQGYESGADDYLTKPFDDAELKAKVRVFLRLKSVEEVDKFKTDLLDLLSHEVRTPMTAILPGAELLMANVPLDEGERSHLIRAIFENTQALQEKFDRIMLLFHFRTNRIVLDEKELDLVDVIRKAAAEWQEKGASKGLEVRVDSPVSCIIRGDFKYLRMVVDSLLENAVEFSPTPGNVRVEVIEEGGKVIFSVTDHGSGFDDDVLPRLFEAFSVGDIMGHQEGLGLSLAINRSIVEAYGGTIGARSEPGLGTTVTVTLPLLRTAEAGEAWVGVEGNAVTAQ